MSYASLTFFCFFLIVVAVYYIMPGRLRWIILLLASYAFYFLSSKWLIFFILITTVSIYFCGLWLGNINDKFKAAKAGLPKEERKALKHRTEKKKRGIVAIAVIINFGLLFLLKYHKFFTGTVISLLGVFNLSVEAPKLNFIQPLGISYYTLQSVSYIVDVYRDKCKPDKNIGRIALFVSFFPQIVEGPIGRYDQLAHQFTDPHPFKYRNLTHGIQLMLWGLFKKLVIADRVAIMVDKVFASRLQYGGITVLLAVALYTVQIYTEFSGCMDIVTGISQTFGIQLAQNFRRPFFSRSVQKFWQRWHITLGTWLKDYIFYPVSLSKSFVKINKNVKKHLSGNLSRVLPVGYALFFVWFCNGMWHGASWKYVCYGLYYYVIMMIGKFCEPLVVKTTGAMHISRVSKGYRVFQIIRTTLLVMFGMLIFRADSLSTAFSMLGTIFTKFSLAVLTNGSLLRFGLTRNDYILSAACILLVFIVSIMQEKGIHIRETLAKQNIFLRWTVYMLAIFSIIIFGIYGEGYNVATFIYGQF